MSAGTHDSPTGLRAPERRRQKSPRPAIDRPVPEGPSTHSPGWSATVKLGTRGTRRLTRHQPPRGDTGHCNSRTIEHNTLSGGSIARSRSINISGIKPVATDKWLHYDQVGSVMLATNASAAVADTRHADAFGNEMASWTSGAWTDSLAERSGRGHNTKELDSDTGLVYMYQRWYLPKVGIFVSMAPYPPHVESQYGFAMQSPARYFDPRGRYWVGSDDYSVMPPPLIWVDPPATPRPPTLNRPKYPPESFTSNCTPDPCAAMPDGTPIPAEGSACIGSCNEWADARKGETGQQMFWTGGASHTGLIVGGCVINCHGGPIRYDDPNISKIPHSYFRRMPVDGKSVDC